MQCGRFCHSLGEETRIATAQPVRRNLSVEDVSHKGADGPLHAEFRAARAFETRHLAFLPFTGQLHGEHTRERVLRHT